MISGCYVKTELSGRFLRDLSGHAKSGGAVCTLNGSEVEFIEIDMQSATLGADDLLGMRFDDFRSSDAITRLLVTKKNGEIATLPGPPTALIAGGYAWGSDKLHLKQKGEQDK